MKKYFKKLTLVFFLGTFFFTAFLSINNADLSVPTSQAADATCASGTTPCPAHPKCCDNETQTCNTTTSTTTSDDGESTITSTKYACVAKPTDDDDDDDDDNGCSDTNCGGTDCTKNSFKKKCKCTGDDAPKCVTGIASEISEGVSSTIKSEAKSAVKSAISGIFSN